MSTIIGHGLQSFALARVFGKTRFVFWLSVSFAVLGMIPDAIPWLAYVCFDVPRWGNIYQWFHAFHWYVVLIPPWLLHWVVDSFYHQPDGGWYWWGTLVEFAVDASLVMYLYFSFVKSNISEEKEL